METCSVENCQNKRQYQRTICSGHKHRMQKFGSYGDTPIKRIPPKGMSGWDVVEFNGWNVTTDGCWEYRGPKFANGYGQVKIDGIPRLLHRVSYERHNGDIPSGIVVRHKCDNKPCMNPSHLELGTSVDNVRDRDERGRTANGDRGVGKFSDRQVKQIRLTLDTTRNRIERGKMYRQIASAFGVSESCIQGMYLRRNYKHVE